MKHYSTKELLAISDKTPRIVQEVLSSESTIKIISNLGINFKLHIDQIGLIAELNVQMLLRLINPKEFFEELVIAKISEKDAKEIITEINQKIFVPLREEMRKGGGAAPSVAPAKQSVQSFPVSPKTNVPNVEQKSHFNLQNKINPPPRQIHSDIKSPAPQTNSSQKVVPPRPVDVMNSRLILETQKPPKSNTFLEDHEESSPALRTVERKEVPSSNPPRIGFNNVPTSPLSAPMPAGTLSPSRTALERVLPGSDVPAPQRMTAPQSFVVRTTASELMPNLPGMIPPAISIAPVPQKEIHVPSVNIPQEKSQSKSISTTPKSYSSDPYREPIE